MLWGIKATETKLYVAATVLHTLGGRTRRSLYQLDGLGNKDNRNEAVEGRQGGRPHSSVASQCIAVSPYLMHTP